MIPHRTDGRLVLTADKGEGASYLATSGASALRMAASTSSSA